MGNATETSAWIPVCSHISCHNIFTWTYGPVTVAFLRVPDGGGTGADGCGSFGSGTPAYNCNSLSQLRDTGRALPAVDKSTTYISWPDFYGTFLGIAGYFGLPRTQVTWLNAPEFDRNLNPGTTRIISLSVTLHEHYNWTLGSGAPPTLSGIISCSDQ